MYGVALVPRIVVVVVCLMVCSQGTFALAQHGHSLVRLDPDLAFAMPDASDLDDGIWQLTSSYPLLEGRDAAALLLANNAAPDSIDAVLEAGFRDGFAQLYVPEEIGEGVALNGLIRVSIVAMSDEGAALDLRDAYLEVVGASSTASPNDIVTYGDIGILVDDRFVLYVTYDLDDDPESTPAAEVDSHERISALITRLQDGLEQAQEMAGKGVVGPGQLALIVTSEDTLSYNWVLGNMCMVQVRVQEGQVAASDAVPNAPLMGQTTEVVNRNCGNSTPDGTAYWWETRMLTFPDETSAMAYVDRAEVIPETRHVDWQMDVSNKVIGPNQTREVYLHPVEGDWAVGLQRMYIEGRNVVVVTMAEFQGGEPLQQGATPYADLDLPIDQLGNDQLACLTAPNEPCARREVSEYFG